MLTSTLSVAPVEEGFAFTLTITNEGEDTVELSFRSGQRFDVVVERVQDTDGKANGEDEKADEEVVWRYSDGRMFTQALGRETLESGESRTYEATWEDPTAGEYEVRGTVTAENVDAEASMVVSVPAG